MLNRYHLVIFSIRFIDFLEFSRDITIKSNLTFHNLSTIELHSFVPQLHVTLLSIFQFPVVIFVILLSKRSSYWQTISRPLPAPVLSPACLLPCLFIFLAFSAWHSPQWSVPPSPPSFVPLYFLLKSFFCMTCQQKEVQYTSKRKMSLRTPFVLLDDVICSAMLQLKTIFGLKESWADSMEDWVDLRGLDEMSNG